MKTKLPLIAVLTALTTALSILVVIPIPATSGIFTLCDAGIYASALLLGPVAGGIVGAASGALIDLISGYPQWIVFSFIIHGLQGYIAGCLAKTKLPGVNWTALILASIWMMVGYAIGTGILYNWAAAIPSIPGNSLQNIFGILVAIPLNRSIRRLRLPALQAFIED